MACLLNAAITRTCDFSVGGMPALYLANRSDVLIASFNASGVVTGLTSPTGGTPNFYKVEYEPGTGQFTEPLQVGAVRHPKPSVAFTLANINQAKRTQLKQIALGNFTAAPKKADGKFYLAGYDCDGLKAETLETNSGLAQTDGDTANVLLSGAALDYAHEISSTLAATLGLV